MTDSDEQLVLRMAVRDENALAELYRRYSPYLAALARRLLQDRDDVQQCVQDAFVRAWEAAERFDPARASAKTWLVTIGHRVALNRLRGKRPASLSLETWDAPTAAGDPVERVWLEGAVGTLEPDERELIELAFYRGHSHQELVALTGKPLGSIKSKLRGALHKLRDELGDKAGDKTGDEPGDETGTKTRKGGEA